MALISVANALDLLLEGVRPLQPEDVSIYGAGGRILAADVQARLTQPPFHASAMDGYAVRAADTATPPVTLNVVGTAAAGHGFDGSVGFREAVRIFTGAPVPDGSDTIVIQEDVSVNGNTIKLRDALHKGRHVRTRGYDFREAETLLYAGTKLRSSHLMLAASMNNDTIPVVRKPVVAVLATGDELVPPGVSPGPDQIVSSVPAGLQAAIVAWGGRPLMLGIAKDTRDSLGHAIAEAAGADIVLTIGGASTGDHDLVRASLAGAGARFDVLKIAMRPGKPVMFGRLGPQRFLSLPGNPVSALVCALVFLKPLLSRLLGLTEPQPLVYRPLAQDIEENGDREHYMRAAIRNGAVWPMADQDSSLATAFAAADCLIIRPQGALPAARGELAPTLALDF